MLNLIFISNLLLWPLSLKILSFKLSLNTIIILGCAPFYLKNYDFKFKKIFIIYLLIFIFVEFLTITLSVCQDGFLKSLLTFPIFLSCIFISYVSGRNAQLPDWIRLEKAIVIVLVIGVLSLILEMGYPEIFPEVQNFRDLKKYSGHFGEPSHVAYSLFPCLMILFLVDKGKYRTKFFLTTLGIFILSSSSTFVVMGIIFGVYLFLRKYNNKINFFIIASLIPTLLYTGFNISDSFDLQSQSPTLDRLLGVLSTNQQSNISSLVYVQGWNDAWINFVRTNGVGLGFNMMGCTPLPENFAREIIENAAGGGLNDTDGSFLFAKVISEFGLFGLIFYVLIIRLIHKSKFIIFSFKANHLNNSYSFKILILLKMFLEIL